jgi:hypothetical protein
MNNMNNARKSSRKPQQAQEEEDDEEDEEDYEDEKKQGKSSGGFFNTFAGMFGMGGGKDTQADGRPDPNKMFGDVFEDMWVCCQQIKVRSSSRLISSVLFCRLAPEVAHVRPFYSWIGGGAGAGWAYL